IRLGECGTGSSLADTGGPVGDGFSVALSGDTVFAGLPFAGDHDIGRVNLYDVMTGASRRTLRAPRGRLGAGPFGTALAVDGSRVAIGTWHDRRWRGCVGLFAVRAGRAREGVWLPRRRPGLGR